MTERETIPASSWERDWIKTEEDHLDRKPRSENIGMMIAIVEHCKGKTMRYIKFGSSVAELSEKYQLMANDHDKLVHGEEDPCKKQFLLSRI